MFSRTNLIRFYALALVVAPLVGSLPEGPPQLHARLLGSLRTSPELSRAAPLASPVMATVAASVTVSALTATATATLSATVPTTTPVPASSATVSTTAPTPTATLTVSATPISPLLRWSAPATPVVVHGDVLTLAVQAVPSGPGIDHVTFVARWPGVHPTTGIVACTSARPARSAPTVYACPWNVRAAGVPNGPLTLSVTAVDVHGHPFGVAPPPRMGRVQQPIRKVVVFLQGICTTLGSNASTTNGTFVAVQDLLRTPAFGYRDADFLLYSYTGGLVEPTGTWYHHAYNRFDPIRQNVETTSWQALHTTLLVPYHARHPNTTFVLVGHSLGGLIAVEEVQKAVGMPGYQRGFLSAVVTVDSPLHGVRPLEEHLGALLQHFPRIGSGLDCVTGGQSAAILASIYTNRRTSGALQAAVTVAVHQGISLVTVGNADDCVWAPNKCGGPPIGDSATQWIRGLGAHTTVFTIPKPCQRPEQACFIGTHGAVLDRVNGQAALRVIAADIGPQQQ